MLTLVVPIVAGMSVQAQAATPPVGYGGAAYAPWTDDQMTYRPEGTGPCLSYDDVRLRNEAAAAEAARTYPPADVSKPNPAAVAAYRAARERLNADLAAMPTKCRVEFAWQVATLAKHLVLHDRQVYLSKDGRRTLISAYVGDLSDPRLADTGDGYDLVAEATRERTNAESAYGPGNGWGAAMKNIDLIAGAYAMVGAAFSMGAIFATDTQIKAGLVDLSRFAAGLGIAIEFMKNFVDWAVNTVSGSPEHASGGGQGRDSSANGDK